MDIEENTRNRQNPDSPDQQRQREQREEMPGAGRQPSSTVDDRERVRREPPLSEEPERLPSDEHEEEDVNRING